MAVAVKRSILDARLLACHQAGIAVKAVNVTALALTNLWRASSQEETIVLWWDRGSAEWVWIGADGVRVVPVAVSRHEVPEPGMVSAPFAHALRRAWEQLSPRGIPGGQGPAKRPWGTWPPYLAMIT